MALPDWTTVAAVKQALSVRPVTVTDDGLIQRLVTAVSKELASELDRDILVAPYDEVYDGTGTGMLVLGAFPVLSVDLLQVGPPTSRTGLVVNQDFAWSSTAIKLLWGIFPEAFASIRVQYTAGYADIPADLQECATKTAAYRYKQLDRLGQLSKTLANETITFEKTAYTEDVLNVLDSYRRVSQGAPF